MNYSLKDNGTKYLYGIIEIIYYSPYYCISFLVEYNKRVIYIPKFDISIFEKLTYQ